MSVLPLLLLLSGGLGARAASRLALSGLALGLALARGLALALGGLTALLLSGGRLGAAAPVSLAAFGVKGVVGAGLVHQGAVGQPAGALDERGGLEVVVQAQVAHILEGLAVDLVNVHAERQSGERVNDDGALDLFLRDELLQVVEGAVGAGADQQVDEKMPETGKNGKLLPKTAK